jgi:hypothetical protein
MSCIGAALTTVRLITPEPREQRRFALAADWPQCNPSLSYPIRNTQGFLMHILFRAAAIALTALAVAATPAAAQGNQPELKQIKLTEKQVQNYVAAQGDLNAVTAKIKGDKPDPKLVAELEAAAKKHGFSNLEELDNVAVNVNLVFSGFDPKTKEFSQPPEAIKKEIAAVNADKSIPEKEKKEILGELNQALKFAKPVQFPENIELVKKYYDKIEATMAKG